MCDAFPQKRERFAKPKGKSCTHFEESNYIYGHSSSVQIESGVDVPSQYLIAKNKSITRKHCTSFCCQGQRIRHKTQAQTQ